MNEFETTVKTELEQKGWTVLRNGWPDFLCVRKNKEGKLLVMAVEAKSKNDGVTDSQHKILEVLSEFFLTSTANEGPGYGRDDFNDFHLLTYPRNVPQDTKKREKFLRELYAETNC